MSSAVYAQFYHYDLANNLSEGCGDRAIIRIDARLNECNTHTVARNTCRERGFVGYQLLVGSSLRNAVSISKNVHMVPPK
jgi:hypothetical protein